MNCYNWIITNAGAGGWGVNSNGSNFVKPKEFMASEQNQTWINERLQNSVE